MLEFSTYMRLTMRIKESGNGNKEISNANAK
jgi:hypothetical protein